MRVPLPLVLIAWVTAGVVRVLLGSSTSPIAYAFFGIFWLISLFLLAAAIRQFVVSGEPERRIESICICVGVASLFLQGLFGHGSASPAAAVVFLGSMVALVFIYGRRLTLGSSSHP